MFPVSHIIAFPGLPFQGYAAFPAILLLSALMRVSTLSSGELGSPGPEAPGGASLQCLHINCSENIAFSLVGFCGTWVGL